PLTSPSLSLYCPPYHPHPHPFPTRRSSDLALTGYPDAIPLPRVIMSGTTSSWLQPNIRPVRPKPVIISSAISSAPYSCATDFTRSEEHTSELQSLRHLVCRLLLEKKKQTII